MDPFKGFAKIAIAIVVFVVGFIILTTLISSLANGNFLFLLFIIVAILAFIGLSH